MIDRSRLRSGLVLVVGLLLVQSGCNQETAQTAAVRNPTTPDQSFAEIVRIVTRELDTGPGGVPSGFVSTDQSSRSQFVVKNQITSQLIPPAKPNENYRGTITITSRSIYSFRQGEGTSSESHETATNHSHKGYGLLDEDSRSDGLSASSDGLISEAPATSGPTPEPGASVSRRPNEDVRTFDLAYENGRWALKTDTDPKTETAIKKAFDYALAQQR